MSKFQKSLSFTGRSEIIRASVRSWLSEEKKKEDLIGDVHAIYVVAHDEKSDNEITEIGYAYGKLINTRLQNKIDKDTFLELFVLKGDSPDYTASYFGAFLLLYWQQCSRFLEHPAI